MRIARWAAFHSGTPMNHAPRWHLQLDKSHKLTPTRFRHAMVCEQHCRRTDEVRAGLPVLADHWKDCFMLSGPSCTTVRFLGCAPLLTSSLQALSMCNPATFVWVDFLHHSHGKLLPLLGRNSPCSRSQRPRIAEQKPTKERPRPSWLREAKKLPWLQANRRLEPLLRSSKLLPLRQMIWRAEVE